jgi:hypothetical protein
VTHYCRCCGYWSSLPDSVYCGWCLDFFGENSRLPRAEDRKRTAIERLWAKADAMGTDGSE